MNAVGRITRGLLIGLVFAFAGCGSLPMPTAPSPTVSIPAGWPDDVPLYAGGELAVAYVGSDGTAAASWDVTGVPEKKVMGAYHKALHEAGFRTTDWFSNLAETGYIYRGNGLVVRAGTIDVEDEVSLTVEVRCLKDCEDWGAAD